MRIPKSLSATVLVFAAGATLSAQTPVVTAGGVLNAASSDVPAKALAPGSLVSIYGSNLSASTNLAPAIPLPTSLGTTSVTFNGVPAPMIAAIHGSSYDQLNVQIPWEAISILPPATTGSVRMVVTQSNAASSVVNVPVTTASPGIFTINSTGSGQAVAYGNSDYAFAAPLNSIPGYAAHPAKIGDPSTLVILATGLGPVDHPVPSGGIPPVTTLSQTLTVPTVLVGGVPAQVIFSGLSQYVGVYQLNIIIAAGTPTGNAVPVQIQMNGITSRIEATIAVSN
jgi:uncharacterized protein (TIGR03437 family)